jgi:hypothetical protein
MDGLDIHRLFNMACNRVLKYRITYNKQQMMGKLTCIPATTNKSLQHILSNFTSLDCGIMCLVNLPSEHLLCFTHYQIL